MPCYCVQLRFASEHDRDVLVPRLRGLAADAGVTADGEGVQLVFDDVDSPVAALVRAQMLIHAASAGTEVSPSLVRRTPSA